MARWGLCRSWPTLGMDRGPQGLLFGQMPLTVFRPRVSRAPQHLAILTAARPKCLFPHGTVISWVFSGLCDLRANHLFLELNLLIYKVKQFD